MSADPPRITVSLVRRLIAARFPRWAAFPVEPVERGGWDNRTFRLGADMSVRLPSAERYAPQVEKEQRWLPVLAPHLPLAVPTPLGMGEPAEGYPWRWSVYRWIDGEPATRGNVPDLRGFAADLARFLLALWRIDPDGGPPPGPHNFFRGGPLSVYDGETRSALAAEEGRIDTAAAAKVWEDALAAAWDGPPVWVHGDVSPGNLLVREGRLRAVIDFGGLGVGDPACDLAVAFSFLTGESREAFRATLGTDAGTWARARGWALWKSLITKARRTIEEVLSP